MTGRFLIDKDNGKLMGVCAGFARWADVDSTLVRVGMVLLALLAGPVALLAYLVVGMVAEHG